MQSAGDRTQRDEVVDVLQEHFRTIEGYVQQHLSETRVPKKTSNRTTHMVAMRQQVKADFLKSLPGIKTCKNCKGCV
jgi:hypothetical protein